MLRIRMDSVLMSPIGFERDWGASEVDTGRSPRVEAGEFAVTSESFDSGGVIPERLAGAEGVSPQLSWKNEPEGTQRFVIIMDDPDAQSVVGYTFVHWVAALPAGRHSVEEGASAGGWTGGHQAIAGDWTSTAYRGPKPPSGTHRYHIAVYAMGGSFDDPEFRDLEGSVADDTKTCTREHFEALYGRDILAKAGITGTYTAKSAH
jgi:Raf kinase inhibitor-like YbhB/YbcL family protein